MKKIHWMALGLMTAVACQAPQTEENTGAEEAQEATTEEIADEDKVHFGEMIDAEGALSIDEFAMAMADKDTLETKIMAVATDVCQKKGCWVNVELADGSSMRIKFKDYAIFLPKNVVGKSAVFRGVATKEIVSVEDQKHYAEDGGKSQEEIDAITEPLETTSFLADAVFLN